MKRRLFNSLTVLSLLLCLATAGLWVRSYFVRDAISYKREWFLPTVFRSKEFVLQDDRGGFVWQRQQYEQSVSPPADWFTKAHSAHNAARDGQLSHSTGEPGTLRFGSISPDPPQFAHWGIVYSDHTNEAVAHGAARMLSLLQIRFPHWLGVMLTAIAPIMRVLQLRRRHRDCQLGLCPTCGYDLRATPDRCPECGAATAK